MGRRKKKSEDATQLSMQELVGKVVELYGSKYDDREPVEEKHASLRNVAAECKITMLKVRKILITAEMYSTVMSRNVQKLYAEGKSIPEIMNETNLSRASVHSYISYKKVVYNLPERSVSADRMKRFRDRKQLCMDFKDELPRMSREEAEKRLWEVLEVLQGCWFQTLKGQWFRYRIEDEEIILNREDDSLSKAMVFRTLWKTLRFDGNEEQSRKPGESETAYLWVIFNRIGLL